MNKATKRTVDFSSGKAVISVVLLPFVLEKYISGKNNEVFIRETINSKGIYSVYINKVGNRSSYLYSIGKAKALTVLKVARKYGIDITNINVNNK
jgi:uncharacterized protein YqjF (DUF2071 family)